jgi:hypothetical protein
VVSAYLVPNRCCGKLIGHPEFVRSISEKQPTPAQQLSGPPPSCQRSARRCINCKKSHRDTASKRSPTAADGPILHGANFVATSAVLGVWKWVGPTLKRTPRVRRRVGPKVACRSRGPMLVLPSGALSLAIPRRRRRLSTPSHPSQPHVRRPHRPAPATHTRRTTVQTPMGAHTQAPAAAGPV